MIENTVFTNCEVYILVFFLRVGNKSNDFCLSRVEHSFYVLEVPKTFSDFTMTHSHIGPGLQKPSISVTFSLLT